MGRNNSEAEKFIKKLMGFSASSVIGAVITFLASSINTRIYDTSTMGKINLFFTAQTFILYFAYFGLDQSYCRYYHEYKSKEDKKLLFDGCICTSLFVTVAVFSAVVIVWRPVSRYIVGEDSLFAVFALLISVVAQVIWRYQSVNERMKNNIVLYTILMTLNSVTNKLSFTSISWISKSIEACLLAIAISSLAVTIGFQIVQRDGIHLLSPKQVWKNEMMRRALRFGIPLIPVSIVSWFNSSIPMLCLQRYGGYGLVGIYSNTVVLVSIISLIQGGFNTFWVPYYYENYKTGSKKLCKVHNVISLIMVAFAIVLMIGKNPIYKILGEQYRSGACAFAFLLISPVCYTIGETTGIGIGISEKSYYNSIVYILGACMNLGLSLFLVPQYGIIGASIAVAVSSMVSLIMKTIIGERFYSTIDNKMRSGTAIVLLFMAALIDLLFNQMAVRYLLLALDLGILLFIYRSEIQYCFQIVTKFLSRAHGN